MNTRNLYPLLAILNGALIAIMIHYNLQLGLAVGFLFSLLIIQIAGALLISGILAVQRPPKGNAVHPFWRIGGMIGLGMVLMNSICFNTLGATMTLATIIFGQSLTSFIIDNTGFLGVRTYRFQKEKILGFLVSLIGIFIMMAGSQGRIPYLFLAFITGAVTIIQMIINARLAEQIGLTRATRNNFFGGIIAGLVLLVFIKNPLTENLELLRQTPFHIIVAGGWIGVVVVFLCNFFIPKIPTIYSSLLQFSGQILTALILDYLRYGTISSVQLLGTVFITAGMVVNIIFDVKNPPRESDNGEFLQQQTQR